MAAGLSKKQITSRIYNRLKATQYKLERAGVPVAYVKATASHFASLTFDTTVAKIDGGFNISYSVSHASNGECFGFEQIYVTTPEKSYTFGWLKPDGDIKKGIEFITSYFKPVVEDDTLQCSGVCKDCGNGTLNNKLAPAFDFNGNGVYCLNCGSFHVDIV